MSTKICTFLWKHRGKFAPISLFTLVGIPALLGCTFFLLKHSQTVGYWVSQEEVVIEVTDKRTEALVRHRCKVKGPDGGCAVYETLTDTLYLVFTPIETFFTKAEIYSQLEIGEAYEVTLAGWQSPALPPRRITRLLKN